MSYSYTIGTTYKCVSDLKVMDNVMYIVKVIRTFIVIRSHWQNVLGQSHYGIRVTFALCEFHE